jgi:DNA-binding PucR family transcriptional regulator
MLLVERAKANVERRKKSKSYVDWAVQSTRRSLDPLKGLSLAKSFFNLIMASKKINALVWKTVKLRVKRSRKISTEAFSILKSLRNLASKSPESQSY